MIVYGLGRAGSSPDFGRTRFSSTEPLGRTYWPSAGSQRCGGAGWRSTGRSDVARLYDSPFRCSKYVGRETAWLTYGDVVRDRMQEMVESNFKLYLRIAADDASRKFLFDWLFDHYRSKVEKGQK